MKDNLQIISEKKYWTGKLAEISFADNLPRDFKSREHFAKFSKLDFSIAKQSAERIIKIARNNSDKIFSILTASIFSLLYNFGYKEADNLLLWIPRLTQEKSPSTFLAITANIDLEISFKELLINVDADIKDAYQYSHYFEIDRPEDPLSNVGIIFQDVHDMTNIASLLCDIKFIFSRKDNELFATLEYNQLAFRSETIARVIECFNNLLNSILENVDVKVSGLSLLTEREKQKLVGDFNQTQISYPREQTVISLFYQQAAKTPQRTAVIFKDQKLSYQEINQKSNQLARMLRQVGVTRNSIVALMSWRSHYVVIGMLAILKAGGAYLPIDPAYPKQRIQKILQDSQVKIILGEENFIVDLNVNVELIDFTKQQCYQGSTDDLDHINIADDLINVIYTSGSTGKPKGVMVKHGSFLNYINWCIHGLGHYENDVSLQLISFAFDAFACNLYPSLLTGGAMLILSEPESMDFSYVRKMIAQYKVTNTGVVPTMYQALLDVSVPGDLASLRFVQLAGDKTSDLLIEKSNKINSKIHLINVYGPTENTVATTAYFDMTSGKNLIIGKPIYNNKLFVLGRKKTLMPVGFYGELCISGDSLAQGYLHDDELTTEKFIPNPFLAGEKMYCTGDLVRWLPDGNLEFIGRIDNQVKIRGLRIETGEIENHLITYEKIKEAIVVKREDTQENAYLCAYIVAQNNNNLLTTKDIREYLLKFMPDYMLPTHFVLLKSMPVNPNGKVDRNLLPDPNEVIKVSGEYIPPGTEVEKKLTTIFAKVLEIDESKISVCDAFFDMGGNSISMIQLTSLINEGFGLELKITDLFNYTTIQQLAEFIGSSTAGSDEIIKFDI